MCILGATSNKHAQKYICAKRSISLISSERALSPKKEKGVGVDRRPILISYSL